MMTRPKTRRSSLRAVVILAALGACAQGCDGDPGDFCHRDSDCRTVLRCSSSDPDVRGICIYRVDPPGPKDSSVERRIDGGIDLRADGPAQDAATDLVADLTPDASDLTRADSAARDMDSSTGDVNVIGPDAMAPDTTSDLRPPDQRLADALADSPGQ